jgi:phospholipid/cholesterol/gamma-HCH transport system substrate-binding protein
MKNTLETRLGIFVALAVIAAVLIMETVGGVERFRRGFRVNGLFKNVQELKIGDRVKMAGVEIGRVQSLSITNDRVRVTMKVQAARRNEVKTDSTATVKFAGLMGQNFVAIDFGSPGAPPASEDAYLKTEEQADMSAIIQKMESVASGVENLTKSFTGDKLDNLLGPLMDFVKANKDPLTTSISNLQAVSTQIAQGKGTVGKLIYDDSLYNSTLSSMTNLQDAASSIKLTVADARTAISDARTILAQVNSGQGTMGKLLKDEALYNEATSSLTTLKEILQKMNQGQGTVGKLINDPDLYRNARMTLQKVDKATEGLEDQGPLSVIGLIINHLF